MGDITYNAIKYIHVISAIIWVGGAFFAQLLAIRAQRSMDPVELPKLGAALSELGMKVFLPASIVLFIAGVILTSSAGRSPSCGSRSRSCCGWCPR